MFWGNHRLPELKERLSSFREIVHGEGDPHQLRLRRELQEPRPVGGCSISADITANSVAVCSLRPSAS
jgi:hypothetical protein